MSASRRSLVLGSIPPLPGDEDVEVVEHKGVGHPDSICDALAESFGRALARFSRDRFGEVVHFNVDKALLVGGAARPAFGGGEVVAPIRMILAGRAVREVAGVRIPVDELAIEAGKTWVREHLHALDPERHVTWSSLVGAGSTDLVDLFATRPGGAVLANDTSIGAGYAPASLLERTVLAAAQCLSALARSIPAVGEDVKVMGVRRGARIDLTVACAFVGRHLRDLGEYAARCDEVARAVGQAASTVAGRDVAVRLNAADDRAAGRVYLTVTGTSAEAGDDGQVGRGNRVNGLITPYRPMTLEAAAGKNPIAHVGKLYNVAAHRIAAAIVARVPAVAEAHCFLVSRIGHPIDDPAIVDVRLRLHDGASRADAEPAVAAIVDDALASLGALADEVLAGSVRLY